MGLVDAVKTVAARLAVTPDEIAAGHCVARSRPKGLADLRFGHASDLVRVETTRKELPWLRR